MKDSVFYISEACFCFLSCPLNHSETPQVYIVQPQQPLISMGSDICSSHCCLMLDDDELVLILSLTTIKTCLNLLQILLILDLLCCRVNSRKKKTKKKTGALLTQ